MLQTITKTEFDALAQQGYNRIPLVQETFADLDTPLSIYLKLANQPFSYLLESVQGGERFGRYSIIGLPAKTRIVANGFSVQVMQGDEVLETHADTNPLDFVKTFQARFKTPPYEGLPRFTGGLAGYFGYETIRYIEKRLANSQKLDVIGTPGHTDLDLSVVVNDMHTMKQDMAHLTDLLNDHMKTGMYYFVAFRTFRYCIVIV